MRITTPLQMLRTHPHKHQNDDRGEPQNSIPFSRLGDILVDGNDGVQKSVGFPRYPEQALELGGRYGQGGGGSKSRRNRIREEFDEKTYVNRFDDFNCCIIRCNRAACVGGCLDTGSSHGQKSVGCELNS